MTRRNFLIIIGAIFAAFIIGIKRFRCLVFEPLGIGGDCVKDETADDLRKLIKEHGTGALDLDGRTFIFGPEDEIDVDKEITIESGILIRRPPVNPNQLHPYEVDKEEMDVRDEIAEEGPAALKITGPVTLLKMDVRGSYEGIRIEGNGAIGTKVKDCTFSGNVAAIVVDSVDGKRGDIEISYGKETEVLV
jgi:hypothetical protein